MTHNDLRQPHVYNVASNKDLFVLNFNLIFWLFVHLKFTNYVRSLVIQLSGHFMCDAYCCLCVCVCVCIRYIQQMSSHLHLIHISYRNFLWMSSYSILNAFLDIFYRVLNPNLSFVRCSNCGNRMWLLM